MFTPQRKAWSGWSLTPRSEAHKNGSGSVSGVSPRGLSANPNSADGRGQSIVPAEPVTPLPGSNGGMVMDGDSLADRVSRLEKELFEYQYNMGLLLIEKKEWTLKHEELKRALEEVTDARKREQAAHLMAISDAAKQEDELRKALGVEKQCVSDLEKTVHEMRAGSAEIKFTADSKLAEAKALAASIEEKSLEVEAKLHAADAKLAEINRKSSEIERKAQDLDSREAALRRERLFFITEQEAHETTFSKQREDLQEWERKLRDGEERLGERLRVLNQREEMANEKDNIHKQKEKDLEEAQKAIDEANLTLLRKEDDISSRLSNLKLKEKEFDALRKNLDMKEKELVALGEKLDARERDEIQKLHYEHNRNLDVKKKEFEFELEQKRKAFDEELERKGFEVRKLESEIKHKEDKFVKKEQALGKRTEKLKEKEEDLQLKLKDLKEKEKSLKSEEKDLEAEKKQLLAQKEELLSFRNAVDKVRAENEELLIKICMEKDQLRVSEEERSEHERLQSELKNEIDKCRLQKELLMKEAEDLKQQKEAFEKEWEDLDEKRAMIEKGRTDLELQEEKFEKFKHSEMEKLQRDKIETENRVKQELEGLKQAQESFEANMKHEKLAWAEKMQSEKSEMLHDLELKLKERETDLQDRWDERENNLRDRMKLFEEEKKGELENVNFLRESARREMEEMKQERMQLAKEREEFAENNKHLEEEQVEIRKDIDQLVELSKKLKDQREKFVEERDRFISFVKKQSSCDNCGEITREFLLSDLQCISEIENFEFPQPKLVEAFAREEVNKNLDASMRPNTDTSPNVTGSRTPLSTGTVSWLRKCTSKIFNFSPGRKSDPHLIQNLSEEKNEQGNDANVEEPSTVYAEDDAELSFAAASVSVDLEKRQREDEDISFDGHSNIDSKTQEVAEDSQPSDLKNGARQPRKRGRPRVNRTRTMKQVVKDASALLGKGFETNDSGQQNGNAEESAPVNTESRDESIPAEKGRQRNLRKRNREQTMVSEHYPDDTEGHSGSIMVGQRGKRRQKNAVPVQAAPGEMRYNLRRPKGGSKAAATSHSTDLSKENKKEAAPALSVTVATENGGSTHFVRCGSVANTQDGDADGKKERGQDMAVSEEVNGTADERDQDDSRSESRGDGTAVADEADEEGMDDEYEDDLEHPGQASIGKKLWKFFTT